MTTIAATGWDVLVTAVLAGAFLAALITTANVWLAHRKSREDVRRRLGSRFARDAFAVHSGEIHLSAQTSMMRAGPNRDYYLKKRAHGATHTQAVIALARRRVDVLWALLREDRTWTATPPALPHAA